MKKFLALFMTLLLAVVMTAVISAAVPSIVLDSGADVSALKEGDTFDAYIIMSPMAQIGTAKNYIGRVPQDTVTTAPTAAMNKLSKESFVVTWDKNSLEVSNVAIYSGTPNNTLQSAGDGMYFAYLGTTIATKVEPTISTYGAGANNVGNVIITYDVGTGNKAGGFVVRNASAAPEAGVVAKITFKVVAGAKGGEDLPIKLNNSYTFNGTNYTSTESMVNVTVCEHAHKIALDEAGLAAAGKTNVTATCCVVGKTWYSCPDCGSYTSVTTNTLDHEYEERVITEPTCLGKGSKAFFCVLDPNCTAHGEISDIDPLGHSFTVGNYVYVEPTCTEDGYEIFWCPRCYRISTTENGTAVAGNNYYIDGKFYNNTNASKVEIDIPEEVKFLALGHDMGDWIVTIPPEDTTEGEEIIECQRDGCDHYVSRSIPAKNAVFITASSGKALAGKTVQVSVDISKNSGFGGLRFGVSFDTDVLTLTSIDTSNAIVSSTVTHISDANTTGTVFFNALDFNLTNVIGDGNLGVLTFEISENAEAGEYPLTITLYPESSFYYEEQEMLALPLAKEDGVIEVIDYIYGDVDENGEISIRDAALILQYLAGWDVDINLNAANVDGDDKVGIRDAACILQYLAGWDVTLG